MKDTILGHWIPHRFIWNWCFSSFLLRFLRFFFHSKDGTKRTFEDVFTEIATTVNCSLQELCSLFNEYHDEQKENNLFFDLVFRLLHKAKYSLLILILVLFFLFMRPICVRELLKATQLYGLQN